MKHSLELNLGVLSLGMSSLSDDSGNSRIDEGNEAMFPLLMLSFFLFFL